MINTNAQFVVVKCQDGALRKAWKVDICNRYTPSDADAVVRIRGVDYFGTLEHLPAVARPAEYMFHKI